MAEMYARPNVGIKAIVIVSNEKAMQTVGCELTTHTCISGLGRF